jgi:hypothetical protein
VLSAFIIRAMIEAASTSETLLNFYQTTWRNNPDDSHLHIHHCENLKSHNGYNVSHKRIQFIVFEIKQMC